MVVNTRWWFYFVCNFHHYLVKWSNLTSIFVHRGWNHQLEYHRLPIHLNWYSPGNSEPSTHIFFVSEPQSFVFFRGERLSLFLLTELNFFEFQANFKIWIPNSVTRPWRALTWREKIVATVLFGGKSLWTHQGNDEMSTLQKFYIAPEKW